MIQNIAHTKPIFIFGTRHGCVYNLTPSNLPSIQGVQLSVGDLYEAKKTIKSLPQGMSFKKFLGFSQNILTYLTPYDFYKKQCITGCQNTKQVKIKCDSGYCAISAEQYDQMAQLIKPDIMVTLTQYPSIQKGRSSQSNKSIKRAINKTHSYLQNSKFNDQNCKKLAAVHGGKNTPLLKRSLQLILNFNVGGLLVCDLCEGQTLEERQNVYNIINQRLKIQKKQFVLGLAGLGKIQDIQHARKFGYTYFEVTYPFLVAQNHKALLKTQNGIIQKDPVKKQDLSPLDNNCKCQSCTNHNQAYIAHLIECHEMTAIVLLTIHNIKVYTDYLDNL